MIWFVCVMSKTPQRGTCVSAIAVEKVLIMNANSCGRWSKQSKSLERLPKKCSNKIGFGVRPLSDLVFEVEWILHL